MCTRGRIEDGSRRREYAVRRNKCEAVGDVADAAFWREPDGRYLEKFRRIIIPF